MRFFIDTGYTDRRSLAENADGSKLRTGSTDGSKQDSPWKSRTSEI